jgi:cytochrome c-type biogenesis protein CcmH/NrfF
MTELYWLSPALALCAGSLIWLVRHKNAARVKNRILRDLMGLQIVWEEPNRHNPLSGPLAG